MLTHMIRHSLVKSARVTAWSLATLTASAALATVFVAMSIDVGEKMTSSLRSLGANAVAHAEQRRDGAGPRPQPAPPRGSGSANSPRRGERTCSSSTSGSARCRVRPWRSSVRMPSASGE